MAKRAERPKQKMRTVRLIDYEEPEINLLAQAGDALEKMESEARGRALRFFMSRYSAEWPSDTYS